MKWWSCPQGHRALVPEVFTPIYCAFCFAQWAVIAFPCKPEPEIPQVDSPAPVIGRGDIAALVDPIIDYGPVLGRYRLVDGKMVEVPDGPPAQGGETT